MCLAQWGSTSSLTRVQSGKNPNNGLRFPHLIRLHGSTLGQLRAHVQSRYKRHWIRSLRFVGFRRTWELSTEMIAHRLAQVAQFRANRAGGANKLLALYFLIGQSWQRELQLMAFAVGIGLNLGTAVSALRLNLISSPQAGALPITMQSPNNGNWELCSVQSIDQVVGINPKHADTVDQNQMNFASEPFPIPAPDPH